MERREGLVLKGIDEPVVAFLVVNERPHVFQLDRSRGVEGVETTTVGREIELRFLQERMLDVVEESRWRVVTVVGDAGVGKSRLLLDFDSWLAERPERVYWFRGRVSHTGQNHANALLRDVVGSRFAIAESDTAVQVRAKLEQGFAAAYDDPGDAVDAHRAAHLVGEWLNFDLGDLGDHATLPDPQVLRNRATEALAEYFARLSTRAPVVVLLEDLHWADDGSLRWLDAADAFLADSRVLVVATSRPSLFEDRPRWTEGLDHHVRLPLEALSRRESRLLLQQLLHLVDDPPTELIDLVIASAEGNPFYIEELVTWLIDAGVIVKGEPRWRVEHELVGSVLVPSTLRGVLQARLDALSLAQRGLLQRASVVGRVFWDDAVDRLAASPGPSDSTATLDDLRRRELVFEREVSSFDSAREFLFKHALLRDVAYDSVLRTHRHRYHARAAAWLAEVSGRSGREDEYAALIAEHYDRAGDPAAGAWYRRAAEQALSVYALAEAAPLLRRALELTDDPEPRFEVLVVREAMLDRIGDRDAQQLDLTEMGELATRLGDPARLADFRIARSRWAFAISEYDEAEVWAEQAATTAAEAGLLTVCAEAHLWQGKALTWHDEPDSARATLTLALDESRQSDRPTLVAESLRYLSMLANNEGDYAEAVELGTQAREAFAVIGDLEGEGMALGQQASTLFNMGRMDEARASLEQVLPIFHRSGHRYREALVLGNLATIEMTQGQLANARQRSLEAIARMRLLADREGVGNNLIVLGMVAAATGAADDGEAAYRQALEIARDVESRTMQVDVLTKWAHLHLDQDEPDKALALAHEADELGELAMSALERGQAQLAHGYAALATGSPAEADRSFRAAEESLAGIEVEVLTREARVGRAAVALALDERAGAVRLVDTAVDHLDKAGLEGSARTSEILWTCWQVLRAVEDPRADDVLTRGQALLREAAARIGDEAMAAAFLAVRPNADLLAARPGPG